MNIETEQEVLRLLIGSHEAGHIAIKRHRIRSALEIAITNK